MNTSISTPMTFLDLSGVDADSSGKSTKILYFSLNTITVLNNPFLQIIVHTVHSTYTQMQ